MALLEDHSSSFIVRIWKEVGEGTATEEWRGSIEHVQSGRKSFFRHLSAIQEFIQKYLAEIGISTPLRFWESIAPDLYADDPPSAEQSVPTAESTGRLDRR